MKKLTLLLFGLFMAGQLFAQKERATEPKKAIIKYFDGALFLGDIIEESNDELSLQIATGDVIHCNKNLAKRLITSDNALIYKKGKYHKTTGVGFSLEHYISANANNASVGYTANVFYRLTPKLNVGVGTGIEFHGITLSGLVGPFNDLVTAHNPWYAYGQYFITDKKLRLYTSLKVGASPVMNIENPRYNYRGGVKVEPEIGVTFASKRKVKPYIGLSRNIQKVFIEGQNVDAFANTVFFKSNYWVNRTNLKMGIYF